MCFYCCLKGFYEYLNIMLLTNYIWCWHQQCIKKVFSQFMHKRQLWNIVKFAEIHLIRSNPNVIIYSLWFINFISLVIPIDTHPIHYSYTNTNTIHHSKRVKNICKILKTTENNICENDRIVMFNKVTLLRVFQDHIRYKKSWNGYKVKERIITKIS